MINFVEIEGGEWGAKCLSLSDQKLTINLAAGVYRSLAKKCDG